MLPNHVKVLVDEVVKGTEAFILPVKTQHYTNLGEIVRNFTQWPMHLVLLEDENIIINSKEQNEGMNEQSDEHDEQDEHNEPDEHDGLSTTKAQPLLVDDDVLQHLGNECKQLVTLLKSVPLNLDYFELELEYAIFHHRNVNAIYVMMMGTLKTY
nr:uncharacterized protein LOC109182188 isoform X1 [Ipomoea batatas]